MMDSIRKLADYANTEQCQKQIMLLTLLFTAAYCLL